MLTYIKDKFKIEIAKEALRLENERLKAKDEELKKLLGNFVKFFNKERIHQGLDYKKPDEVYKEGSFPSAIIKKMVA